MPERRTQSRCAVRVHDRVPFPGVHPVTRFQKALSRRGCRVVACPARVQREDRGGPVAGCEPPLPAGVRMPPHESETGRYSHGRRPAQYGGIDARRHLMGAGAIRRLWTVRRQGTERPGAESGPAGQKRRPHTAEGPHFQSTAVNPAPTSPDRPRSSTASRTCLPDGPLSPSVHHTVHVSGCALAVRPETPGRVRSFRPERFAPETRL